MIVKGRNLFMRSIVTEWDKVAWFGASGLLSAAHPDVIFPYSVDQVIAAVLIREQPRSNS
jgi:hypothetical protein